MCLRVPPQAIPSDRAFNDAMIALDNTNQIQSRINHPNATRDVPAIPCCIAAPQQRCRGDRGLGPDCRLEMGPRPAPPGGTVLWKTGPHRGRLRPSRQGRQAVRPTTRPTRRGVPGRHTTLEEGSEQRATRRDGEPPEGEPRRSLRRWQAISQTSCRRCTPHVVSTTRTGTMNGLAVLAR